MQRLLAIGGKLALICTVAALVLALVNAVTAPVIEQNRIERLNQ
ncbi:MAG: FMN-binding protein, partial [Spirochaetes bacterium]|nr:FMN-binding protein [Spirochaetota bacterium]